MSSATNTTQTATTVLATTVSATTDKPSLIDKPTFSYPPFNPPFWLTNPHLQTILPKFFQPDVPNYRRSIERDSLNESDVAYDYYDAADKDNKDLPLVVLFHGMEGSSDSHYARALAHHIHAQGWHFVVAHFRSCGGIPASGQVFYTAGDTGEVHYMLQNLAQTYTNIYAVGVSLGGNALAKYMGEYSGHDSDDNSANNSDNNNDRNSNSAICKAAVVISAPVDMSSAAMNMQRFISQKVYAPYLLNPIIKKAMANQISDKELKQIKAVRKISDFDHIFTAPRHGYRSNNDYYRRASALPYLIDVSKPLLLISAGDDPFIGFTATPNDVSDCVTIIDTDHGGHIGFLSYRKPTQSINSDKTQSNNTDDTNKIQTAKKRFDIDWIPETVIAYFNSVGIDGTKQSHKSK